MKIGILTYHRPCNFGANLQAYASTCYLKSLGHEVKVIDYTRSGDLGYRKNVSEVQYNAHSAFVKRMLPLTRQVFDVEHLVEVVKEEKFDAILVGADAVWRSPKDDCIFFCKWLVDAPELADVKIASISAAHMGNGFMDIDETKKEEIAECLKKFSYITVRDEWTRTVINRDIFKSEDFVKTINPDPVIVLSRFVNDKDWNSQGLISNKYYLMTLPKDWAAPSNLSSFKIEWFRKFQALVHNSGYQLVELPLPEGKSGMPFDKVIEYPIDPLQWFLMIRNAKAFCGLRFHAIVSSISNGTPFYSFDNYGQSSNLNKLADMLGFHKFARRNDYGSKIRNLLQNSPFENYRTGSYLEYESPKHVFHRLESTTQQQVEQFRDQLASTFDRNMKETLETKLQNKIASMHKK